MEEFRIKIGGAQKAQIEVVPTSDGGVEIVVHYGEGTAKNYGSSEKKPSNYKKSFTPHAKQTSAEDIIEGIKTIARKIYNQPDTDKDELTKFVKFYEKKISESGWNGPFDFDKLFERWLNNKR